MTTPEIHLPVLIAMPDDVAEAVREAEDRCAEVWRDHGREQYEQGQRDALAAGGGAHYTDCAFLSGGGCNCRPQTSPDGEASTPHATAPVGSETSVAPAGEDYGAHQRIDTVRQAAAAGMKGDKGDTAVALEQELAAMHDALHAAYLSGIRVALERVDPTGRAAKQLRDLLASEEAA